MSKQKCKQQDPQNILELFIERTETLAQFVSETSFFGGLFGIFRNTKEEEWQIHPLIYGSLCILRSFLQSSDCIALYLLERDAPEKPPRRPELLDLPGTSDNWREVVNQAYQWIDKALAIAPENLTYKGKAITRFEVLDTFLYGKFVHLNIEKRVTYNQWKSEPDLFEKLQDVFVNQTLSFILGQISDVAAASRRELALLRSGTITDMNDTISRARMNRTQAWPSPVGNRMKGR